MATVAFIHLGKLYGFDAGATHHWAWNNAGNERVWSFSVDAYLPLDTAAPGQSARVEVTRVEYRYNYGPPFEREIHFWVKNTGTVRANYYMHMTVTKE